GLRLVLDHGEGDLAAGVDLADLHLDLLTDLRDVLDVLHALAAVQLAQLCDVEQAVLARGERAEGAEADHAHDGAEVALADLAELRLDRRTGLRDVLDVLDALAAVQLAQLGDVEPAVLARGERDEGAEVDHAHDGAEVALADLGDHRVGDGVDRGAGRLGRGAVGGTDVDGAVVLDGDVGARVVLDLVDHLALGADDRADLVDRDGHCEDA